MCDVNSSESMVNSNLVQVHEYFRAKEECWRESVLKGHDSPESYKIRDSFRIPSSIKKKRGNKSGLRLTPKEVIPKLFPFLVTDYKINTHKVTRASSMWVYSMKKLVQTLPYGCISYTGNKNIGVDDMFVYGKTKEEKCNFVIPFMRNVIQTIQVR